MYSNLPSEIIESISLHLDPIDVLNLSLTSNFIRYSIQDLPRHFSKSEPYHIGNIFALTKLGCKYDKLASSGHHRLLIDTTCPNLCLIKGAKHGHIKVVQAMIQVIKSFSCIRTSYMDAIGLAARHGHSEIVKLLHSVIGSMPDILHEACLSGSYETYIYISQALTLEGRPDIKTTSIRNGILEQACEGGNIKIIEDLMTYNPDTKPGVFGACKSGNKIVFHSMLSTSRLAWYDYDKCIKYASSRGHLNIIDELFKIYYMPNIMSELKAFICPDTIRHLLRLGVRDNNVILSCALSYGDKNLIHLATSDNNNMPSISIQLDDKLDLDIVLYLYSKYGAILDIDLYCYAAYHGLKWLASLLDARGVKPNSWCILHAINEGHLEMFKHLESKMSRDITGILRVCSWHHYDITEYILDHYNVGRMLSSALISNISPEVLLLLRSRLSNIDIDIHQVPKYSYDLELILSVL